MKVKCTANYFDKDLNKAINIGEELEVSDARATILVGAKVCEAVTTPTPEVATEPAPKKKAPAKKAKAE